MDTPKEKVSNVHIKDRKIIQFKACEEGLFYTNFSELTTITHPTNVSPNAYSYLFTVK